MLLACVHYVETRPSALDCFTVFLHCPNGWHLPAVRAVQGDCQWPLQKGGNAHRLRKLEIHCD